MYILLNIIDIFVCIFFVNSFVLNIDITKVVVKKTVDLWDLSWSRSFVISTCPILNIKYLILENLQYT